MGACSSPGTASPSTAGEKTTCVLPVNSVTGLFATLQFNLARARADFERRMRAADGGARSKLFETACRTFLTLYCHFVHDVVHELTFSGSTI